jgi:hypothetical protein
MISRGQDCTAGLAQAMPVGAERPGALKARKERARTGRLSDAELARRGLDRATLAKELGQVAGQRRRLKRQAAVCSIATTPTALDEARELAYAAGEGGGTEPGGPLQSGSGRLPA